MQTVPRKTVIAALNAFCDKFTTYAEAAAKLGVSQPRLSSTLNDETFTVPQRVLVKLGFSQITGYARVRDLPGGKAKLPSAKYGNGKPKSAKSKKKAKK